CYSLSPTPRQPPKILAATGACARAFAARRPIRKRSLQLPRRRKSIAKTACDAYFAAQPIRSPPLVSRIVILMLQCYKRFLSPLFGSRGRFHPSGSDYARVAVARFGTLRGGWLGLVRIARCQPLCTGGLDPVPDAFEWWPMRHDRSCKTR